MRKEISGLDLVQILRVKLSGAVIEQLWPIREECSADLAFLKLNKRGIGLGASGKDRAPGHNTAEGLGFQTRAKILAKELYQPNS